MDIFTQQKRSEIMSRVKSKNTKPELFVFSELDKLHISFERHFSIPGTPDVALPEYKIAIFINGEYWHGKRYSKEKGKYSEYWQNKIRKNMKRDMVNVRLLKKQGWRVIKIWEKQLKKDPKRQLHRILDAINTKQKMAIIHEKG